MRATKDIDVFVRVDPENAGRVIHALTAFGAPLGALGIDQADFAAEGRVVQIGVPPLRIDLLTSVSGIDFGTAVAAPGMFEIEAGRSASSASRHCS